MINYEDAWKQALSELTDALNNMHRGKKK